MSRPEPPTTLIVGAGAAGAVIAARLSADASHTVLLVEAGPDYDPQALPPDLLDGTRNSYRAHDWGLKHEVNAQAPFRFPFPRGRVVGGSSAVNTCIALRGQPYDYDEWAEYAGPQWSWQACLPYFQKLERDLDFGAAPEHGEHGPLPVRRHPPEELTAWQAAFVQAARKLGYADCPDSNLAGTEGVGPHAMNKIDGQRISAAQAWLTPEVRARPNLKILPQTLVRRVCFEGRRAVGVEVERAGEVQTLRAEQVVLSAGAIHTPGILLRSGIGPQAQLQRLGVERVQDLPGVAARLLDHPGCALFMNPRWGVVKRSDPLIQTVLRYTAQGGRTADMLLQPGSVFSSPWGAFPLLCSVMAAIGKPSGHGQLRYDSADPRTRPTIISGLLEHPDDLRRAVEAMQRAYALCQMPPMRALARHVWPRPRTLQRKEACEAWVRHACDSGYHPCGTVPMGLERDPLAACDGYGRVRGVARLRVADASLMPTIPSSNIHLATLMIGERLAEWLGQADDEVV